MRRPTRWLAPLVLLLWVGGCQGTTVPERRELLGSWVSAGFPGGTIRMTMSQTARSVEGAGSWITPTTARAFGISGAIADDEVSLLFDLDDSPNVNFQGAFTEEDVMVGSVTGAGFQMSPITFEREDLLDRLDRRP